MRRTKFLIVGKGYVSRKVTRHFFNLNADYTVNKERIATLREALDAIDGFDCVINCAGVTGGNVVLKDGRNVSTIDWCEDHIMETNEGNVLLPFRLAKACEMKHKSLVHVGSGCIYTGNNEGEGFSEEDEPNFFGSEYSVSKIVAEKLLRDFPRILQLRIRMPFDGEMERKNLLVKVLFLYDKLLVAQNSFTCMETFPEILIKLALSNVVGVYNVVCEGSMNAREIVDYYNEIADELLEKTYMDVGSFASVTPAGRSNCILSVKKLKRKIGNVGSVQDSVRRAVVRLHEFKKQGKLIDVP